MKKLLFWGAVALLIYLIVSPSIKSVGKGYQEDMNRMMNFDNPVHITENASSFQNFVELTPNGSKELVKATDKGVKFLDYLIVVALFGGVGLLILVSRRR